MNATEKQRTLIRDCHDPPTIGHMGITKTLARVREKHIWKGIRKDVTDYVKNYHVCVKIKHIRIPKKGQHQAIEAPDYPFQRPALDFVTGFPETDNPIIE